MLFIVKWHWHTHTPSHIIRALNHHSYETVEVTGPQMVLTMKLTTFAWNVFDARRPDADLDPWQRRKRISAFPGLLPFLGYVFYFPGLLVGPYLDYAEYTDLVHQSLFKHPNVVSKLPSHASLPPGRKSAAYLRMLKGLFYLAVFVLFGSNWSWNAIFIPEFKHMPFLHRSAPTSFQINPPPSHPSCFIAFSFTKSMALSSVANTTPFGPWPKGLPSSLVLVSPVSLSLPLPLKNHFHNGMGLPTSLFLKSSFLPISRFCWILGIWKPMFGFVNAFINVLFPKIKNPGNQLPRWPFLLPLYGSVFALPLALALPYVSWPQHGVAAGYYITFIMGAFVTASARLARQSLRPIFISPSPYASYKPIYDLAVTLVTLVVLNYITGPFIVSTWENSVELFRILNWYGHAVVLLALVFFGSGGGLWVKHWVKV